MVKQIPLFISTTYRKLPVEIADRFGPDVRQKGNVYPSTYVIFVDPFVDLGKMGQLLEKTQF